MEKRDTPICEKCKQHTVLVSGHWYYKADSEPYKNGVVESAPFYDGEAYLYGFICGNCEAFHSAYSED